ncbi:DUF6328 family protein [Lacisediminihabitans changchengi]|uniref:Sodium:proton antiporter n=1 Tax=Lacisediminihabitans changchengi TaxID=2787634 RepID=A0A934SJV5_9MICO|nr:DUF6328 family protein [Lacisediminihabitans changchengi]MBK4346645.1 sodium:proton antiporter [Lacisediminihabitans changchengi]
MTEPLHPANRDVDPADGRPETASQRYDRNWDEILQELRVTQTGTQIMSGFLLTLPFQQRFADIQDYERVIYIVLVILAATTTAFGLAPVALHRRLFRRHAKEQMVGIADVILQIVLVLVSVLTSGVVVFLFGFLVNLITGVLAGCGILVVLIFLLLVLPRIARRRL